MGRTRKVAQKTTPRKLGGGVLKKQKKAAESKAKKQLALAASKTLGSGKKKKSSVKREPLTPLSSPEKMKKESFSEEDMSEYELTRLRNIQERQAMLGELLATKSLISAALTPARKEKSAASKRGLTSVKKEKEILPPRKSARIAGGKVPEIERYVPELQPEPENTGLPLETLKFKDTYKQAEEEERLAQMEKFMTGYCADTKIGDNKMSFGATDQYAKRFSKLSLTAECVAKVVPDRIFSLDVHPSAHKILVAAGGKWGGLGLWDVEDKESEENGVYLLTPHSRPINFMSWDRFNSNQLITTSYDGTSRITDLNKLEHRLLYGDEDFLDLGSSAYVTFHAQIDANTFLVAKGGTGMVGLVDVRTGHESTVQDYHVFERVSAKSVDVHPVQRNLFLAANNKSGCYIFDTRQQSKSRLMDPVCELSGHTKSVSSATFSPITGNKVMTICWDDKLRLFNTQSMSGELRPACKPRAHNNQTGRWLTPFKGHWHAGHDDLFLTGSMGRPREIEAWQIDSSIEKLYSFQGEEFGSISSIVATHPSRDVVVGGNSSGRVHVFM